MIELHRVAHVRIVRAEGDLGNRRKKREESERIIQHPKRKSTLWMKEIFEMWLRERRYKGPGIGRLAGRVNMSQWRKIKE